MKKPTHPVQETSGQFSGLSDYYAPRSLLALLGHRSEQRAAEQKRRAGGSYDYSGRARRQDGPDSNITPGTLDPQARAAIVQVSAVVDQNVARKVLTSIISGISSGWR